MFSRLDFPGPKLLTFVWERSLEIVSCLRGLRSLDMSQHDITEERLAEHSGLEKLHMLDLKNSSRLTGQCLHCLRRFTALQENNLSGSCNATDVGLEHLCALTNLSELSLHTCSGCDGTTSAVSA
jgi:hypothetical protein